MYETIPPYPRLPSGLVLRQIQVKRNFFFHGWRVLVGVDLIIETSRHIQTHHIRKDSSGRVIGPTHRPLSDNTQHSQGTDIYAPAEFEPAIPASEGPQTHALDRTNTVIGNSTFLSPNLYPKC